MELSLSKNESENVKEIRENTITTISREIDTSYNNNENIYLIYQYFVPSCEKRKKEINYCLKKNYNNENFKKIFLLNEKIYSKKRNRFK